MEICLHFDTFLFLSKYHREFPRDLPCMLFDRQTFFIDLHENTIFGIAASTTTQIIFTD